MDKYSYLEDDFIESLNSTDTQIDNGLVDISGALFKPSEILKQMNPEEYTRVFDNWIGEKREDFIDKAKEILELHSNKERFETIRSQYNKGFIIPFIGAGLSISSGYIGWTAFLRKLLNDTNIQKEEFDKYILEGKYEELAQKLQDELKKEPFIERVCNYFENPKKAEGVIRKLPDVFNKTILTTNFDPLLELIYLDKTIKKITDIGIDEIDNDINSGNGFILKLHGDANDDDSRILTKDEYDLHYLSNNKLLNIYRSICKNSLLFIGASLSVDRTVQTIKKVFEEQNLNKKIRATRHYALLELSADLKRDTDRVRRENTLAEYNIYPIWYPEGEHDTSIEALLEYLMVDGN